MSDHRLLSFTLRIGDTSYQGTPLPSNRAGWLLLGLDGPRQGSRYEVWIDERGPACSCPDFVFRKKRRTGETCKHLEAVIDVGLLREPNRVGGEG